MNRNIKYIWIVLSILPILLVVYGYLFPSEFFSSQDKIRDYVNGFGLFTPIVFILLQIAQVVITPFSHYVVSLAGGYIFGTWYGALLNWVGRVFGTLIAFYIARRFGRFLVAKFVSKENMEKYATFFENNKLLLFLVYFLPVFPDDELSYLAGVSNINFKTFAIIAALGHISGSISLAYTGNGIESFTDPVFILINVVTFVGGLYFVYLNKRRKLSNA